MKQRLREPLKGGRNINMNDGFKPQTTEESQEFENLENAQSAPAQPKQQSQQQPLQKPQETFNVKDEVGKAIETAQQSVFGPTDPAQIQKQEMERAKKKQEDQRKIANVKQFLSQMAADEQRLRQQRQEEAQKKQQEKQEETEVEQEKEMKKQKKERSFQEEHIKAEQTKAERKLGVGG